MKPIILQVPNRDANSAKMIRPGQAMFSGLQNAPDSDRFTLFLRRLRVRIPPASARHLIDPVVTIDLLVRSQRLTQEIGGIPVSLWEEVRIDLQRG